MIATVLTELWNILDPLIGFSVFIVSLPAMLIVTTAVAATTPWDITVSPFRIFGTIVFWICAVFPFLRGAATTATGDIFVDERRAQVVT